MKNIKESNSNEKEIKFIEIEISLTHEDIVVRKIPVTLGQFTAATDTAFEILKSFKGSGKTYFAVYMILLKHRNMRTNKCFPSISTISEETKLGVRTVKEAIDTLWNKGYLSINSGMRGISNNYYFPKEWFYEYFEEDIYQCKAERRKNPLEDNRPKKTDINKENEELKKENQKLKEENILLKNNQKNKITEQLFNDDDDIF